MINAQPPAVWKLLLEGRAGLEWASALLTPHSWFGKKQSQGPVLLLPGLLTNQWSMRVLGDRLRQQGYTVHDWSQGFNRGPRPGVVPALVREVRRLHKQYGEQVTLVGWSMGGCLAVGVAARAKGAVAQVVTIGAPLGARAEASHLGKAFRVASGVGGTREKLLRMLGEPAGVPVTAIVSLDDGLLDWRGCLPESLPNTRVLWMRGVSHLGMPAHPAVAFAIMRTLSGKRSKWPLWTQPFLAKNPLR